MTPPSVWIGRRLKVSELRSGGRFQVPSGGRALLVVAGATAETLGAGTHDLHGLATDVVARIRSEPAPDVALLNDAAFDIDFTSDTTGSADGDAVDMVVRITMRLADPHLAASALIGGRDAIATRELQAQLAPAANDALRSLSRGLSTDDLLAQADKTKLQLDLLEQLSGRLAARGLLAVRAQVIRANIPVQPRERPAEAANRDSIDRRQAELDRQQAQLQDELARLQGRTGVLDKLLDEKVLERMSRLESEEEWRRFRRELDRRRYLEDKEWHAMRSDAAATADEAEIRGHYLFKRIAAMSEFEFTSLQQSRDASLRLLEAQGDTALRQEAFRAERAKLDAELEGRQRVFARELEERRHWFEQLQREQASASDLALLKVERLEAMRRRRRQSEAAQMLESASALSEIQAQMTPEQILAAAVAKRPESSPEIARAMAAMQSGTVPHPTDDDARPPTISRSVSAPPMASTENVAAGSVGLAVPGRITTTGHGTVLVPVQLYDRAEFDAPRWRATCWIEDGEARDATAFDPGGIATLNVPGSYYGRLPVRLELRDTLGADRYNGTFILALSHEPDGSMIIQPAAHAAHAGAVIYQPVEVSVPLHEPRPAAVEGKEHIRVEVHPERQDAVRLSDLTEPQRLVQLRGRPGGIERVLTIHQGDTAVLGRCHAWQLDDAAAARLARAGSDAIHWITRWDDPAVNRLSARLTYRDRKSVSGTLEIENLTDYSAAANNLLIEYDSVKHDVAAGFCLQFAPLPNVEMRLVGRGRERSLLRFVLREASVGNTHVPVLLTSRTRFDHPPDGADAHSVRFLGVWLPWPPQRLRALLAAQCQPLSISFIDEACQLDLYYEPSVDDIVIVASEDLLQAMDQS